MTATDVVVEDTGHGAGEGHAAHGTSTGLSNVKIAMWAFLGSECLLFGALISTYLLYRGKSMVGPYPKDVYDIPYTSVSSFVLLMSSLTMVLALAAIQRGDHRRLRVWLLATALLGSTFIGGQAYEFTTFSSTNASTPTPATADVPQPSSTSNSRPAARRSSAPAAAKKLPNAQTLDPTLHLNQLALTEQIKYEGSGRNIFVAQADAVIPTPGSSGATDQQPKDRIIQIQAPPAPPPIPLKFFGFASHSGETKKIFLSKAEDVFIAGEGEIVDRRYKVVRISPTSVEIQDLVVSGPPQSVPLTQERP